MDANLVRSSGSSERSLKDRPALTVRGSVSELFQELQRVPLGGGVKFDEQADRHAGQMTCRCVHAAVPEAIGLFRGARDRSIQPRPIRIAPKKTSQTPSTIASV